MTYKEARELKTKSMSLIGTEDEKGFIVGDILILPTDENKRKEFLLCYITNEDAEYCIAPYMDCDVQVIAVDTTKLKKENILFYNTIGK